MFTKTIKQPSFTSFKKNIFNKIAHFKNMITNYGSAHKGATALFLVTFLSASSTHAVNNQSSIPESIRAKTEVAVSNYPLFLLSEEVTKGAPSAKLLLDAGDVGHHASLSPNAIRAIKKSRYVIWFGEGLETNLTNTMNKSPNSIALFDIKGFKLKSLRDVKGNNIKGTIDPHIWLDPANAKAITRALGAIYSRANPTYAKVYAKNVKAFAIKMDNAVMQATNWSTNKRSYWAYHDAFSYIEPTLKIKMVGALTSDHHLPPKASQFYWLKSNRPQKTMCMVLQSDSNKGVLSKLQPLNSTVQQEDMSHAKDFVKGWGSLAKDLNTCIGK